MIAAVAQRYGPAGVISVVELPDPEPRPGQVVVAVKAASLNPLDFKLRNGDLRLFLRLRFPAVLGFDLAGEVVRLGDGVTQWEVGDRVYGRIESRTGGTHAELATIDADVIDWIPERLSFEEAAALPLTGMTVLQGLENADLKPGQKLLINGAAGGVGSLAVQIAAAEGASVVGICRAEDDELVRNLGAVRTLDYTNNEFDKSEERFDVVFDTVYKRPIGDFTRRLTPGGTYTTTGFSPMLILRSGLGRISIRPRIQFISSRADGALMRRLSTLVASRDVNPVIDSTWPLDDIRKAYERLEREHTQGKVVITLS